MFVPRIHRSTLSLRLHTSTKYSPSSQTTRRRSSGEPKVWVYHDFVPCVRDAYFLSQAASYASSSNSAPFLAYFEATTPSSPSKHARLRTALFLQTSNAYDASAARVRLAPHAPLLAPELAIIAGKVCAQSTFLHPHFHNICEDKINKCFDNYSSVRHTRRSRSLCEPSTTTRPPPHSVFPPAQWYPHTLQPTSQSVPGSPNGPWPRPRHHHRRQATPKPPTAPKQSGSCTSC